MSILCMSIMCISIMCVSIMCVSLLCKPSAGQHTRCCVEAGGTLRKEHFRHCFGDGILVLRLGLPAGRRSNLLRGSPRPQRHDRGGGVRRGLSDMSEEGEFDGGVRRGLSDMREEEADVDADADVDEFDVASATCARRMSLDAASAT